MLGVPVADEFAPHLQKFIASLEEETVRCEIDLSDDRFGKKIRNASKSKVPFILIVGEEDMNNNAVSFRFRDGSQLACGKPIRGHVAFLGGPLHFLSELKAAFIRTLNLDDEHAITPENSHLFAAIGSALNYKKDVETTLGSLQQRLSTGIKLEFEVARLDPLFASQEDYDAFTSRHGNNHVETGDLKNYSGNCYLGIDAGSTTTKIALVSEDGKLLYSFYDNNNGSTNFRTSSICFRRNI